MIQHVKYLSINKFQIQSNIHASLRASDELVVLLRLDEAMTAEIWH